jgi:hypothetical protein
VSQVAISDKTYRLLSRYKLKLRTMIAIRTDAICLIKIIALFAVGIEPASSCKNWKLSTTGWSHRIFDAVSDSIEVSIEYTWLSLFSEQDQCIRKRLEERRNRSLFNISCSLRITMAIFPTSRD